MSRLHLSPFLIMAPLAAFTALFVSDSAPRGVALPVLGQSTATIDAEAAQFGRCLESALAGCVIDGDTIWYLGRKIRLADINAPEVGEPGCRAEAELGERATRRLTQLLNEGPFSLEPIDRERDRYGRLLRTVTRDGRSLGDELVGEGLAEPWQGRRRDWCRAA